MSSAPFARKSRCLHICLHKVRVLPNHIFVYFKRKDTFILIIYDVYKDLTSLLMKIEDRFYLYHELIGKEAFYLGI